MIIALDQLNGVVNLVICKTCNKRVAIVALNEIPDLKDVSGKAKLAEFPPGDFNVECSNKNGTHKVINA